MIKQRFYVVVSLKWIIDAKEEFLYPRDTRIAITGYRESEGINDLFSVIVEFLDVADSDTRGATRAKLYALAEEMESHLPTIGEKFVLTAGAKPIAECIVLQQFS
jgi:hypothetical protein